MIQINFGVSGYSRFHPGCPWEERVMEIPESGKLPSIPGEFLDTNKANPTKFNLHNYVDTREYKAIELPAVLFKLPGGHSHESYEMYLVWLGGRGEWIAIQHCEWSESDFNIDESEAGPYALNDYCKDMLMQAYSIPSGRLSLQEIVSIEPTKLEKLASEK